MPWPALLLLLGLLCAVGCDESAPADDDDTAVSDDDSAPGDDDDTTADDDDDDDSAPPLDEDGDGWTVADGDCDDADAGVHPGAAEICGDGVDQDCGGEQELTVPSGDFPTIQQGINAALNGDKVCVGPGTYAENIDFNGTAAHVLAVDGPEVTVIDGRGGDHAVQFATGEGEDSVLEGFTITHGVADHGGGIYVSSASPTLRNLVITGNSAVDGGGLHLTYYSGLVAESLTITDNEASGDGGGIYIDGSSDAEITDLVLRDNTAQESGGGAFVYDGTVTVTTSEWTGNESAGGGGALQVWSGDATLIGATVTDNAAGGWGGGLYLYSADLVLADALVTGNSGTGGGGIGHSNSTTTYDNVVVSGNTATAGGGGVYLYGSDATLTNLRVAGNSAAVHGGGIGAADTTLNLTHATIVGNTALYYGGGFHSGGDVTARFTNATFNRNTAGDGGGGVSGTGDIVLTFCNVWGNAPDDFFQVDDPTGVMGNVSLNPSLLDASAPDPADWDLHLASASPLIDTGDGSILDPDGSPSDIGAYGGPGAAGWDLDDDGYPQWWLPGPYDPATSPAKDCDDLDENVYPGSGC
jgi:predicted outer membrane repeat protein/parallel beta-helix repeat protein